ncbi:MAG: PASTA domain-containing protein, partial [Nitrospirae bacterium]|nr:PASTA domain-containing protein [Nitrospirota bacterium]
MIRKIFKLAFYFLGFASAGFIGAFLVFKLVSMEKTVKAPFLEGKSLSEAAKLLDEKGLSMSVQGEEYDTIIPEGHIIKQDVIEGDNIKKGSTVKVFVSRGAPEMVIPYLEGMDLNDVKLTLESGGLEIGKITSVHSGTVAKNIIIAQRPLSGQSSERKVNLLVSLGTEEVFYKCPSFVKMTIEEA